MKRVDKSTWTLEQRVADIERHGSGPARHIRRRQLLAYSLIVVVGAFGIYSNRHYASRVDESQDQLRQGLVRSCEVNANPLRDAVRLQIKQQIQQSKTFDASKFFPSVPPKQLHHLIAQGIRRQRAELVSIPPINCQKVYQ